MAYFPTTASGPGILGEMLTAALGQNSMLWRTSPIATELEVVVVGWLRQALGLPETFDGLITDTASTSSLIALAAAREAAGVDAQPRRASPADADVPQLRVYASVEAHSSIEKACMTLGLGRDVATSASRRTTSTGFGPQTLDGGHRRRPRGRPPADRDRRHGRDDVVDLGRPGRRASPTSPSAKDSGSTSTPPTPASSRSPPSCAAPFAGWERADSIVVNPHKWLFTPLDASLLLTRRLETARDAFSVSRRSTCGRSIARRRSATTTSTRRSSGAGSGR